MQTAKNKPQTQLIGFSGLLIIVYLQVIFKTFVAFPGITFTTLLGNIAVFSHVFVSSTSRAIYTRKFYV